MYNYKLVWEKLTTYLCSKFYKMSICALPTEISYRFLVYRKVYLLATKMHTHKQNLISNNPMGNSQFPCLIEFNGISFLLSLSFFLLRMICLFWVPLKCSSGRFQRCMPSLTPDSYQQLVEGFQIIVHSCIFQKRPEYSLSTV